MQLSKNLSLRECTKSITAQRLGVNNEPEKEVIENLKSIANKVFQPVRDHFGCPIYISSGYRSADLNRAVNGSKNSQHVSGEALDLDADVFKGVSNADIFRYIKDNLEFDQLIWEFGDEDNPDWVHVSYKSNDKNRGRCLKATRDAKGVSYSVIF